MLSTPTRRRVRRRPSLPNPRAALGGVLVSAAVLGSWWLAAPGKEAPPERYVVAARPIDPGGRFAPADLRLAPVRVGHRQSTRLFTDVRQVAGTISLGPMAPGELVQRSTVGGRSLGRTTREVSFQVDAGWALGGQLVSGDHIDLLVTYGEGLDSQTRRVLSDVVVRRIGSIEGSALAGPAGQTITVGITDPHAVLAAANAAHAGKLTVVRSTGAARATGRSSYRPAR